MKEPPRQPLPAGRFDEEVLPNGKELGKQARSLEILPWAATSVTQMRQDVLTSAKIDPNHRSVR
jgi:hypothetical protein